MKKIEELTRKDLIRGVDDRSKRNSKELKPPTYVGISRKYTITLKAPSSAGDGSYYIVKLRLLELPSLMPIKDLTLEEKVRLALDGDIAISCTCPAYQYFGYKYIVTQLGSNFGKGEDRFPVIRNPKLEGSLCKHGYASVKYFGRFWKKIVSDIKNKRFI